MSRLLLGSLAFLLLVAGVLVGAVAMSRARDVRNGSSALEADTSSSDSAAKSTAAKSTGLTELKLTEFTLTERSGKKFSSRELAGKVHVVNFFFSRCPTVCRSQTAAVAGLAKELGPEGVVFLSITCDPANDTPATLAVYAQEFNADRNDWLFLTGDLAYLRRIGEEMYSLPVDVGTHSEKLLVVDKWGQIRKSFSWKDANQLVEMRQTLRDLLAETERPDLAAVGR